MTTSCKTCCGFHTRKSKLSPEVTSRNLRDEKGKAIQIVVWREQIGPDTCRVLVSEHRLRWLAISSLNRAVGFIIESDGATELLDTSDVEQLFL